MRKNVVFGTILIMGLSLAGCGDVKKAAEDGFKKEFVPAFTQECAKAAATSGIATDTLTQICGCTATQLSETQSMTELASLDMEKAMPIFEKCAADAGLQLPGVSGAATE